MGCGESQSGDGRSEACRPQGHSISIIHANGFTLIELLVVLAAIALLMAILVPVLSRARKQAKATVCQARLKQWGTILARTNKDANAPQDSFFHFRTKDLACCPLATKCSPAYQNAQKTGMPGSSPIMFNLPPAFMTGTSGPRYPAWVIWAPEPAFVGSYGTNRFLFQAGFQSTMPTGPSAIPVRGLSA